jgi:hypothetical protein
LLLIFGGTAKEYIHLFTDHTDTVHCNNEAHGLVIEPEHHHCSFLICALPLFLNTEVAGIRFNIPKAEFHTYQSIEKEQAYCRSFYVSYLRGPPAIV